jgi:hypothetical protein
MNDNPELKQDIEMLTAETLALQVLFVNIIAIVGNANPAIRPLVLKAFDESADLTERMSITTGLGAGHITKALQVIEHLRMSLTCCRNSDR